MSGEGNSGGGNVIDGNTSLPADSGIPDFAKDWADQDTAKWIGSKGFKDVAGIAKSYRSLDNVFNADKAGRTITKPSDPNDKAQLADFYHKLGRPDNPTGYKLNDTDATKQTNDWFRQVAYDNGLTPEQAASITDAWANRIDTGMKASNDEFMRTVENEMNQVKAMWGKDYDRNRAICAIGWQRALELSEEEVRTLETVIGTKRLFELTFRAGSMMQEDIGVGDIDPSIAATLPKDANSALAEIKRLETDKEFYKELHSQENKIQKSAQARWDYLHKLAYPGG